MRFVVQRLDKFIVFLVASVLLATFAPVHGHTAVIFDNVTELAIGLLFFLHGAKLSRQAIWNGIAAWRVHLAVCAATFLLFPVLGLMIRRVTGLWLDDNIGSGLLLLCLMPSTVQSSIAFTAIARGNVPAAVCSASISNVLGIFLTPLLAEIFLSGHTGAISKEGIVKIIFELLVPFIFGNLAHPVLSPFLSRHKTLVSSVDRGAILLVVYTAFSAAVTRGLWDEYSTQDLIWTLTLDVIILAVVMVTTTLGARALGFDHADEVVIVFCGSKKSLASGVPLASALFSPAVVGPLLLPLMLFHQLQLMACAIIAEGYARRFDHGSLLVHTTDDMYPFGVDRLALSRFDVGICRGTSLDAGV